MLLGLAGDPWLFEKLRKQLHSYFSLRFKFLFALREKLVLNAWAWESFLNKVLQSSSYEF